MRKYGSALPMQRRSRSILPSLRREWAQTDQRLFGPNSLWLESRPSTRDCLRLQAGLFVVETCPYLAGVLHESGVTLFCSTTDRFSSCHRSRSATSAGSKDDAAGVIAAKLQPMVEANTMAGVVTLVASKDKVLDLETVGYADVAAKKAMAPDDLFWIASMSKGMTAAAMMMLVDEGKVNVNDPVEKYLPEFRGQMVGVEQMIAMRCSRSRDAPSRSGKSSPTPPTCRSCRD